MHHTHENYKLMIKQLQNRILSVSQRIHTVFQLSYAVEAKLLGAIDFPPLQRPLQAYLESSNTFLGYLDNDEIAGVIEIEITDTHIDINSLVIHPTFFRRGIATSLLTFVFNVYDTPLYLVETGLDNNPATALYLKLGFKEVKQWDTDFGIRKVQFERRR